MTRMGLVQGTPAQAARRKRTTSPGQGTTTKAVVGQVVVPPAVQHMVVRTMTGIANVVGHGAPIVSGAGMVGSVVATMIVAATAEIVTGTETSTGTGTGSLVATVVVTVATTIDAEIDVVDTVVDGVEGSVVRPAHACAAPLFVFFCFVGVFDQVATWFAPQVALIAALESLPHAS